MSQHTPLDVRPPPRKKNKNHDWTPQQITIVRALYPTTQTASLAAELGIPCKVVSNYAEKHGIKKAPEFLTLQRLNNRNAARKAFLPVPNPGYPQTGTSIPTAHGSKTVERVNSSGTVINHRMR